MEFLTYQELVEITGYHQRTKQKKHLKNQHIQIKGEDRFGTPLVLFKDVFGFHRHNQTTPISHKTSWQPPPP